MFSSYSLKRKGAIMFSLLVMLWKNQMNITRCKYQLQRLGKEFVKELKPWWIWLPVGTGMATSTLSAVRPIVITLWIIAKNFHQYLIMINAQKLTIRILTEAISNAFGIAIFSPRCFVSPSPNTSQSSHLKLSNCCLMIKYNYSRVAKSSSYTYKH
mgnify:CR=1 FL=1